MLANLSDIPYFSDDASLSRYVLGAPAFYWTPKPQGFDFISDDVLALVSPIVTYWIYSLFFHILDSIDSPFLDRHRIHDSAEVKSKNLVTRTSCLLWVAFQQVIQTLLGLYWMEEGKPLPPQLADVGHIKNNIVTIFNLLLGEATATRFLRAYGADTVWFTYWWAIPLGQLTIAM